MVAARARVGEAAEAEELAADLRAAAAAAGTSKIAKPRHHAGARHVI